MLTSIGGVGSTALGRHIGSLADKSIYEHAYSPSYFNKFDGIRLGYMFGDPYSAVISIFRRKFQSMHIQQVLRGTDYPLVDLHKWSLTDYLEEGKDLFHLEDQFDNWVKADGAKHSILLIKYESLNITLDEVLSYYKVTKPFELRERKSKLNSQPVEIVKGLEAIYGGLKEKVDQMPALKLILRGTSAEEQS